MGRVDSDRLGTVFRVVRIRRNWRQEDVAARARVSRATVARIEQGRAGTVTLGAIEAVAASLEIQLRILTRWHGSEAHRLVNAGHAAMHETMARFGGERGVIDILVWHAASAGSGFGAGSCLYRLADDRSRRDRPWRGAKVAVVIDRGSRTGINPPAGRGSAAGHGSAASDAVAARPLR